MIMPASAEDLINFNSTVTQITSPSCCGVQCCDYATVTGTSVLNRVWVCVQGPTGKTAVLSAAVSGGNFSLEIPLCDGPGKYIIWTGDNPIHYDGVIRFELLRT